MKTTQLGAARLMMRSRGPPSLVSLKRCLWGGGAAPAGVQLDRACGLGVGPIGVLTFGLATLEISKQIQGLSSSSALGLQSSCLAADPLPTPTLVIASALALLSFGTTLATNQVFHGGLWGKLRNDSVTPRVDVQSARVEPSGDLCMTLERNVGPETYGAFLVDMRVKNRQGELLYHRSGQQLAELQPKQIMNRWLVRVKPGPHGLLVPLGSQAKLALPLGGRLGNIPTGNYTIELEDVSGLKWEHQLAIEASATCSYDGCCRGAA